MAISVGLMNILSCPMGGMPLCHGSGGLAGQYRFGARSSLSVVMLGFMKLIIGLFLGAAAFAWMQAFPSAVLGVFLIVAGAALAESSKFWKNKEILAAGLIMIAVYMITNMLLAGFAAGWIALKFGDMTALRLVRRSLGAGGSKPDRVPKNFPYNKGL